MSTSANSLALFIDDRWKEVELLIALAQANQNNEALYHALCRSSIVLMIAHFEGFIKACVKAVIDDINKFSSFRYFPTPLKQTYCTKLVQAADEKLDNRHLYKRVANLSLILDDHDIKLDHKVFLVLNEFGNDQSNPKPELIEKICGNFGVIRFFDQISNSDLDIVFEDEKTEVMGINRKLADHLSKGSYSYPYNIDPSLFGITLIDKPSSKQRPARSIWQTFLDELHRQRHAIAHGTSINNDSSPEEIARDRDKLRILEYAFMLVLCHGSLPNAQEIEQ